jgi:hypothetical protein
MDLNDTTLTMIAEIPDPTCSSVKKSKYVKKYTEARASFRKYAAAKRTMQQGTYKLVGVCFFDQPHKQKGVAPNAVEIHPVISFSKIK